MRWPVLLVLLGLAAPGVGAQELFIKPVDPIADEVEAAYVKGLNYLASTQTSSGTWSDSYGNQPAVVGLAVLAMLAHGEDPNAGLYSVAIKRGLDYILSQVDRETGYIGPSMYNHGFATLALAEAYGTVLDPRLGPALQRAVDLIVSSQQRNPMSAWRYSPESNDADTTVSGAQMVALFAARNAGIAVSEEAIQKGVRFFLRCQTSDGGFGYTSNNGPNSTRTAIGTLVLALNKKKDTEAFKGALQYVERATFQSEGYPFYHEYYMSQALFQSSEEAWNNWNQQNIKHLVTTQAPDGSWQGQHGPFFCTAAALLSLALNYRFLPIYER